MMATRRISRLDPTPPPMPAASAAVDSPLLLLAFTPPIVPIVGLGVDERLGKGVMDTREGDAEGVKAGL